MLCPSRKNITTMSSSSTNFPNPSQGHRVSSGSVLSLFEIIAAPPQIQTDPVRSSSPSDQQCRNHVCRLGQRSIESARIVPAGFGKVRSSTALAADHRRKLSYYLARLHPARQVFCNTDKQRNLAIGTRGKHHHATPQPAAHLVDQ